jgi:hypothetical protein
MAKSRKQAVETATEIEFRNAGLSILADMRGEHKLENLTDGSAVFVDERGDKLKIINAKSRPVPRYIEKAILENSGTILTDGKLGLYVFIDAFATDDENTTATSVTMLKAIAATYFEEDKVWLFDENDKSVVLATFRAGTEYSIIDGDKGKFVCRQPKGWNWSSNLKDNLNELGREYHHRLFNLTKVFSKDLTVINAYRQAAE